MENSRLKKIAIWIFSVAASLILLFFITRNYILILVINKVSKKVNERFDADLKVKEASFSGFSTVNLYGISLIPSNGYRFVSADTLNVNVSVWALIRGIIKLKELNCSGAEINIRNKSDSDILYNFLKPQPGSTPAAAREKNFALLFNKNLDRAFNLAPQKVLLKNVSLTYQNDTLERWMKIIEFHSDENSLEGIAFNNFDSAYWNCKGKFSQSKKNLDLTIFPSVVGHSLPMSVELFKTHFSFDTLSVSIGDYLGSENNFEINGKFSINNMQVFNKRISDDTVKIKSAGVNYKFIAEKNSLTLDSSSTATLSSVIIHPFLQYYSSKEKQYTIALKTDMTPASDFFSSLPVGVFDEVRDIEAEGNLQFSLAFNLNTANPDSVNFETTMRKEKFRIRKYGISNLSKMNGEFLQSVYEHDRLMRSFMVGPSNPSFTPLENISLNVINSILTSEDGNFYFHNGFNEEAFRKSIAANYKAGKFVRGGSTISMQLVKNVFLNRKKTIARKAEEALIVWMIENNRITSKERMLEVYLNIVEFGPNIYGIGEASSFYFNKRPSDITLPEGIFISSLLPHPKWFKYSFDTEGNLKPYLAGYYRILSDFMLRRNLITQTEHDTLQARVVLTGAAREMVVPSDTVPEDENDFNF